MNKKRNVSLFSFKWQKAFETVKIPQKIRHLMLITGAFMLLLNSYASTGYRVPDETILEIYNTPPFPYLSIIPFSEKALFCEYQSTQTLEDISEPNVKLAGQELSKRLHGEMERFPVTKMDILDTKTNHRIELALPENIKIRNQKTSYDNRYLALSYEAENGIKLMIVDLRNGKIQTFPDIQLNDATGHTGYTWMNDGRTLLLKTVPPNWGEEPAPSKLPQSPIIEETEGKFSQMRTHQNLLQNSYDEQLFEYYFTVQLMYLNVRTGKQQFVGEPGIFRSVEPSPDNQFIFVNRVEKPYSYLVPYYFFPQRFEIWDKNGALIKVFHERPLQDEIPIGGTYQGPRNFQWQPLYPAKLVWTEALDEGDPRIEADERDAIYRSSFPYEESEEMLRLQFRFSSIDWSESKDEMIVHEYDRDNLWSKGWLYDIKTKQKKLLIDLNVRDNYSRLGWLIKKTTRNGERVFIKRDGSVFFLNNTGATPEGNRPFVKELNLETVETKELFRSKEGRHERIYGFLSPDLERLLIRSESLEEPPNFSIVNLSEQSAQQITHFENPYPEEAKLQKELVTYYRKDDIPLSGTLYLPADYTPGTRLPLVLNAYPREFTDAATAGQISLSPNQFDQYFGTSVKYFTLKGFAVLASASFPIIGDPETVNETFIEQVVANAQAAIDYLDEREIIDPNRVGVTGHSYGAFMVANLLAHSDICAAGIARSGAYNRTLTPFGFQSERRTLWEATDFYIQVSPYMHAEKVNQPILLIHGENDPNSGTYPMQTERFYQALKGNGATAKMVILPHEGHGYTARESQLHVLAEQLEWFEKHVKNRAE